MNAATVIALNVAFAVLVVSVVVAGTVGYARADRFLAWFRAGSAPRVQAAETRIELDKAA